MWLGAGNCLKVKYQYSLDSWQEEKTAAHPTVPTPAGPWHTAAVVMQAAAFWQEPSFDTGTEGASQGSMSIKGLLKFARDNRNRGLIKSP